MKNTRMICLLALTALGFLAGCTTVERIEPSSHTTSTTTEQTTVTRPYGTTVETQTTRAY